MRRFLRTFLTNILALMPLLLLLLALAIIVRAQPVQNVNVAPACQQFFSFTAIGTSSSYDNRTNGCDFWVISYSSITFAGPLSLSVRHAPNAVGGIPGVWADYTGAQVVAGVNPNVSLVGAETQVTGYYPWIRVNLSATGAGAGTVVGTLYGWRTGPPSTVSIGGIVATNLSQYGGVAVGAGNALHVQPGTAAYFPPSAAGALGDAVATGAATLPAAPMAAFPMAFNGATWDRVRGSVSGLWVGGPAAVAAAPAGNPVVIGGYASGATGGLVAQKTVCDLYAPITLAAAIGYTEIVPLVAARQIRVCNISISFIANETPSLAYGTGASCATGTTAITGAYSNVLTMALDFADPLRVLAANALCVRQTIGSGGGGLVNYAIY
jgi:hypothetical protein